MASTLDIVISVTDKASAVLDKVGDKSEGLGNKLKGLAVGLGAAVAGFASFKVIEGAIAATAKLGEEVYKLQKETGLSAEDASRLLNVFDDEGVSAEALSKSMGVLSKNLLTSHEETLNFTTSASTFTKIMDSLGIATEKVNGGMRSSVDVLLDVADKFHGMADGAEKTGLAMQIFGKSGKDMIPVLNEGKQGLIDLMKEADKLGVTLSQKNVDAIHKYVLSQREMDEALGGLRVQIGLELMPVLTKFANWFVDNQPKIRDFFEKAIEKVKEFADVGVAALKGIEDALQWIPDHQEGIVIAIAAIGAAMVVAWGPESVAFLALATLIGMIDKVAHHQSLGIGKSVIDNAEANALANINKSDAELLKNGYPGKEGYAQLDKNAFARSEIYKRRPDLNPDDPGILPGGATAGPPLSLYVPAAKAFTESLSALPPKLDAAKEKVDKLAQAMAKWQEQLASSLEDGEISWKEFVSLNVEAQKNGFDVLSDEIAGHMEALAAMNAVDVKAEESAFNFTKTITKLGDVFARSNEVGKQLLVTMGQETLAKLQSAASSIFGRPTQEQALLQMQLAQEQERIANFSAGGATDAQLARENALMDVLQKKLSVELAHTAVLQASETQADKSLLTAKQQDEMAHKLIDATRDTTLGMMSLGGALMPIPQAVNDALNAFRMFTLYMQTATGNGGNLQLAGRGV